MPTFIFNKLIRDKILQMHLDEGHALRYETLAGEDLKAKLRQKLHEEADEIPVRVAVDNEIIEEISDVQQVLDDLKREYGIDNEQIRTAQQAKFAKKGGFADGVYIKSVSLPEDDAWVRYYRASPDKYPETDEATGKVDSDLPTIEKGIYRHTKSGRLYDVIGVTFHTETYEPMVVYVPQYTSKYELFARPYNVFTSTVELDGRTVSRFKKELS